MITDTEYYHLCALRNGDEMSFQWIFNKYHHVIYCYCLRFIKQKTLAEEAAGDVFILLWKKREIINIDHTIQPFLYKIAKDTAYNYLKKIASNKRLMNFFLEAYSQESFKNVELIFIENEELEAIHVIVESLPPKRREVFQMRFFEGKNNKAIAEQLHISSNTVKAHLVKARIHLKQYLQKVESVSVKRLFQLITIFLLSV